MKKQSYLSVYNFRTRDARPKWAKDSKSPSLLDHYILEKYMLTKPRVDVIVG